MSAPGAIFLFPLGLVFGSFATVLAHRLPRGENFVSGRSKCPHCDATVAAYDNIPVLSWLMLRGHCRSCGERISVRYPLTELSLAVLWVVTYLVIGTDDVGELVLGLILCAVLVTVTVTDLELKLIPNTVLAFGAIAGLAVVLISDPSSMVNRSIAAAAAGGGLLIIALAYPRGMGMGDVKLAALLGFYLGRAVGPAMLIAFAAGALVGVAMMIRHGAAARKRAIPFGPFLALGGVVGLLAGNELVDAYLDAFVNG